MRTWLFILFALAVPPARLDAQQCRADFDGSGAVEINELIAAVNEALSGCEGGAATPTRPPGTPTRTPTPVGSCPYRFNQAVGVDRFCGYAGTVQPQHCDPFQAGGGWTTQDTAVIAVFEDEFGNQVGLDAVRTSPTAARVTSISFGPDFSQVFDATGMLSLPSAKRLTVTFNAGGSCGTYTQNATFFGLLGNNALTSGGGSIAELRASLEAQVGAAAGSDSARDDRIRALGRAVARRR